MKRAGKHYPVTPDGRYFVVKGRLWRMSDPGLDVDARKALILKLMTARRAVGAALRAKDKIAEKHAREGVDAAKIELGERGPVWWDDDAPDLNRRSVGASPYADWFAAIDDPDGATS